MNAFHRIKHFLPFCVSFSLAFPQKGSTAELEHEITPKPILLRVWEEATGPLRRLVPDGGGVIAEIGPVFVLLPPELEEKLRPHVGAKIAIIRTDDTARPYRIRLPRR